MYSPNITFSTYSTPSMLVHVKTACTSSFTPLCINVDSLLGSEINTIMSHYMSFDWLALNEIRPSLQFTYLLVVHILLIGIGKSYQPMRQKLLI